MIYFDPMYFIIVAPGLLLAMWATFKVKSTFKKYSKMGIASRKSGAEVARDLLKRSGISDVDVELHQGFLSDHYHPVKKVVRLSPAVYEGRSSSTPPSGPGSNWSRPVSYPRRKRPRWPRCSTPRP